MTKRRLSPGELERAYSRADRLRLEAERKERLAGRRIEALARGLAARLDIGAYFHRRGVGIHAFDVDGIPCLAASYLEDVGGHYKHRYAVLCGGEAARRALHDAPLDPGDSDEPGPSRRVALAAFDDYVDFVDRLPLFLADLASLLQARVAQADVATQKATKTRAKARAGGRRRASSPAPRSTIVIPALGANGRRQRRDGQ